MISKINYSPLKHCFYVVFLLLIPLLSNSKEQISALFEKGNEQYAKAKYHDAILAYQKIVDGGYFSSSLYFNMGNAYYKLGEVPSALLYYEKARKIAPGDDDIQVNIRLANLKTIDKIEETPPFFFTQWWNDFILFFPLTTLTILSVLFFLSSFTILTVFLFIKVIPLKKTLFYAASVLLLFGLLSVFVASRQLSYFTSHPQAIIFTSAVTVKSEPEDSSKNLFVIHKGTKVSLLENHKNWMKIELSNGKIGWILSTDAKKI